MISLIEGADSLLSGNNRLCDIPAAGDRRFFLEREIALSEEASSIRAGWRKLHPWIAGLLAQQLRFQNKQTRQVLA